MSVQVANISLAGAIVGTAVVIPLGRAVPPPTLEEQMRPQQVAGSSLFLFNESGCGITCLFPLSRETFTLPAGQWRQVIIPPGEEQLQGVVSYLLPNAPVSQLFADLYLPGEAIDPMGVLGNSPIGGGVPLSVAQVINDNNPAPTTVLEATQSGNSSGSNALIDNEGNAFFAELVLGPTYQKILQVIAGVGVGGDALILGANKANYTHVQNKLKADKDVHYVPQTATSGDASDMVLDYNSSNHNAQYWTPQGGAANGHELITWDGAAGVAAATFGAAGVTGKFAADNSGTVKSVGGVASDGPYGVPLTGKHVVDTSIADNATHNIGTFTVPNVSPNPVVRFTALFVVPTGNTNNGVVTLQASYTDPFDGVARGVSFALYGTTTLLSAAAITKRANQYICAEIILECKPNTSVGVLYQNNVAGTIGDTVTAIFELL